MTDLYFSPARCIVNLEAIKNNFRSLGSPGNLMPVIKSDAYGHGLLPVAEALDSVNAARFAVGIVQEGIALREKGFKQQIVLLMGCNSSDDWGLAQKYDLTPLLGSFDDFEKIDAALGQEPISVCVKCDSGMSRLGFTLDEMGFLLDNLRSRPHVNPCMTASHFACADMPDENEFTGSQSRIFENFYRSLHSVYNSILPSLGNSAASLDIHRNPDEIFRPGLILYGGNPFYKTDYENLGSELEWAMELAAPIIQVRALRPGQSVSYGCTFTAEKAMRVAIVACGYSQGYLRQWSNRVHALVQGVRVRQVGRICMGMLMLDVSSLPDVREGDLAWLVGGEATQGHVAVTIQELSDLANTIPYELLCIFGAMNPRVYR